MGRRARWTGRAIGEGGWRWPFGISSLFRDVTLEVGDRGSGEPVVFTQTALIVDELLRLASELALADGFRRIVHQRRGDAGSSPVDGPRSIPRDEADGRSTAPGFVGHLIDR